MDLHDIIDQGTMMNTRILLKFINNLVTISISGGGGRWGGGEGY